MDAHKSSARNLNIIVLGDSQVGKSSLILRYTEDSFTGSFSSTLGIDFKTKTLKIGEFAVKLSIWDTSGQERFRTVTKSYYDKAMGVILVYDCTDVKSFQEIKCWITQIENHARPDIVKVLLATKCDKEDVKVTPEMGQILADEYELKFFVTSAKTGQNVNEAFNFLAEEVCKQRLDLKEKKGAFVVEPTHKSRGKRKNNCC